MSYKFIDKLTKLIGTKFVVNYETIVEHKFFYKTKISIQCQKCLAFNLMSIDAIAKRLLSNNIPYVCRKCVVSETMQKPSVRKKCQRNSRSYWRNEIIKESMVRKSNQTKFMNKLDKAFED